MSSESGTLMAMDIAGMQGDRTAPRVAGVAAVASGLLLLVSAPPYVAAGSPPSLQDAAAFADYIAGHDAVAISTKLVDSVYIVGFIVFVSGFRQLIRTALPRQAWIADLFFGLGLVHASVVLVGDVLGGGAALDTVNAADPTAVRALTEASIVAFGPINFVITALFLAAAGYAILSLQMAWPLGWAGYLLSALNIFAVPAVYVGNDFLQTVINGGNTASGPYSYISALAGGLYSIWLLILGIAILRVGPHTGTSSDSGRSRMAGP